MIVRCERCTAEFQLEDGRVPVAGVSVRCSQCKHVFHVEPSGSAAERIDRAAEQALEDAPPGPEAALDLDLEGALEGVHAEPDEDEESDWEFNHEGPLGALEEESDEPSAGLDPGAMAVARDLVEDLLSPSAKPTSASSVAEEPLPLDVEVEAPAPPPVPELTEKEAPFGALDEEELAHDELGEPGEWDLLASEEPGEPSFAAPLPVTTPGPQSTPQTTVETFEEEAEAGSQSRWFAKARSSLGWVATASIFSVGLAAGLLPWGTDTGARPQRVGDLRVADVEARWVENASGSRLYVVSARLENPGTTRATLGSPVELEFLDGAGRPLGVPGVPLAAPFDGTLLREADPQPMAEGQVRAASRLAGVPLAPASAWRLEGVVGTLPAAAERFRFRIAEEAAPMERSEETQIEVAPDDASATRDSRPL